MKLDTYICEHRLTQGEFAKLVGASQGAVSHWLSGKRKPSLDLAKKIVQATNGVVAHQDLRPDLYPVEPKP